MRAQRDPADIPMFPRLLLKVELVGYWIVFPFLSMTYSFWDLIFLLSHRRQANSRAGVACSLVSLELFCVTLPVICHLVNATSESAPPYFPQDIRVGKRFFLELCPASYKSWGEGGMGYDPG